MKIISLIVALSFLVGCSKKVSWQEEVTLVSGKIIVDRSVLMIPGELGQHRASIYEVLATDPSTKQKFHWKGQHGLNPIMLNFKEGTAYLITIPFSCDAKTPPMSINGLPYFLQESSDGQTWKDIDLRKLPASFTKANLSYRYDPYYVGQGKFQKTEAISAINDSANTEGFFQVELPKTLEQWHYKSKDRYHSGCG